MRINVRQICFIMIAYTAASKLLTYPTILSLTSERDVLFPVLANFLIEGVVIWALSYLCSKTDKTFYELLSGSIGKVGAKIVYGFFAAFFLLATILPIFEQKLYVHNIFYDTVPSLSVFLPFFIFTTYAATKKLQNIGRCADICLPVFLVMMAFVFLMAFSEVEFNNLLPVLRSPLPGIVKGATGTLFNFCEPCWLLMFMGRFKYGKGDAAKITLSYAAGAAIVLAFVAVFVGVYGPIAPSRTFAVARTSLFFPAIETIGRVDLLVLFALEIVMLFGLVLNIQLGVQCISACTGLEDLRIISLAVNAALLAILVTCDHNYRNVYNVYHDWLWIVFLVFTVLLPTLAWTLKRGKKR